MLAPGGAMYFATRKTKKKNKQMKNAVCALALTTLHCKIWGCFPCVQTYYAGRVAARIIYS